MTLSNQVLIINGYLERISKRFKVDNATAFEIFSIAAALDKPFDEIAQDILVKGKNDGGFDGIYFEKGETEYVMHLFQTKTSKNIKQNELDKFRSDYHSLFVQGNKINKDNIQDLSIYLEKYKKLAEKGENIIPKFYYIFRGDKTDNKNSKNALFIEKFHKEGEFEIWDETDLFGKITALMRASAKSNPIHFVFNPRNSNLTVSDDVQAVLSFFVYETRAAVFRITAIQLCELLAESERVNGSIERIFAANIRGFLGHDSIVNAKINETLASPNKIYFPFLNNGITMVCQKFILPRTAQYGEYTLKTTNPSIVNGLQTSYLLYEAYKKDKTSLIDVDVVVRLYETESDELIELITDATNTQSAINFGDKLSNKPFDKIAKEFFENKGIAYLNKRGETFTNPLSKEVKRSIKANELLEKYYHLLNYDFFKGEKVGDALAEIFKIEKNPSHILYPFFNGELNSVLYGQMWLLYCVESYVKNYTENKRGFKVFKKEYVNPLMLNILLSGKFSKKEIIAQIDEFATGFYKEKSKSNEEIKAFFNDLSKLNEESAVKAFTNKLFKNIEIFLADLPHYGKFWQKTYKERIEILSKIYVDISDLTFEDES